MQTEFATERRSIGMPDGRVIEILTAGPADGLPLVLHEGTPVGLHLYPPTVASAAVRGLRVVLPARPGYEGSTPRPGRRVADVARDVADVLNALGADTFLTAGWSGGGPHALACAALLPGRCLAAASIAGVAPYGARSLDWTAGMGPENVAEFGAALAGEASLTEFLENEAAEIKGVTGAQVADALGGLVSAADKAALTGEYAEHMAAALRAALSSGIAGWRDDDLAFTVGWGFTLGWDEELTAGTLLGRDVPAAPVAIWQGDQDRMVPYAHGEWLAAHVQGARAHLLPGEGHLTLTVTSLERILDDLLDLAGLAD
ncbi:MAG: alpha/beta fold hydrolase [Streptosporangiaceae bacterium]|nr:alpha/beta fold hydrolase [Streptosporangiaceae bacterium]